MRKAYAITAASLTLLPGCGKPFNEQIDLVGKDPLPALSLNADAEPLSGSASLQGWDRRHWPLVKVQVPTTQTAHYRTYVHNLHLQSDGGPWEERFPTAVGALDDGADGGGDVLDAVVEPAWAAVLLVWAPIDMVILQRWPWNGVRSPDEPYDRVPPATELDLWPWIELGEPQIQWTDEGAGAEEPQ
ncbi:MAG: hypothetical protein ACYS15_00640 [Planctomycetota bacterium]|jgi:hypothetical protein